MKKGLLFICLSIIVMQAFGYSVLERFEGTYITNMDARSAAMGGAAVAGGNRLFDADINPANLALLNAMYGGTFNFHFTRNEDKRSFPMYNFFDGYVDDATYVANEHYFQNLSFGLHGSYDFDSFKLAAGLFYTPYISFDCLYDEQVRNNEGSDDDNYPPIIAKNRIEGDGIINQLGFVLAVKHHERFAWGLKLSKLSGEQDYFESIFWTNRAVSLTSESILENYETKINREFDAFQFTFGGNVEVSERINVGFSFTPTTEFDVSGTWDFLQTNAVNSDTLLHEYGDIADLIYSGKGLIHEDDVTEYENLIIYDGNSTFTSYADYKTPTRTRLGIGYRPRNIVRTYFNVDFEHVKWSDVNSFFDDEMNYFVGIEHQVTNYLPFRLGFRYATNYHISHRVLEHEDENHLVYFGNKVTMPGITAGTGFTFLEKFTVDISGEFTHRTYETIDLFQDGYYRKDGLYTNQFVIPKDRGWSNPDTVKENFTLLKIALTYRW